MKIKAGTTIYTILRHVSANGMFRVIDAIVIKKNEPISIMFLLNDEQRKNIVYKWDRNRQGFKMSGCGMDMGFQLVYTLSSVLFPKGFKVNDKTIHRNNAKNGTIDKNGGYALKQMWL